MNTPECSIQQAHPAIVAAAIGAIPLPTSRPAPALPRSLMLGSAGEDVRTLQRALGITVDGSFGPITDAAVRAWQSAHHLIADGIVGPNTRAALGL